MKNLYKLKRYLLLFILFCSSLLVANAQRINMNLENVTVREAITAVNKTASYSIAIKTSDVDMNKRVTVKGEDATIQQILDQIFVGQRIDYSITGNSISVTKSAPKSAQTQAGKEERKISGVVLDDDGERLAGCLVFVPGTSNATTTNGRGEFVLDKISTPTNIDFSLIGFETQSLRVSNYSYIRVVMGQLLGILDEVVVVGYGTQKKGNVTGAVSSISGKELNARPVVSAANALQGADPSLNITFGKGSPESGYSINIRGVPSIRSTEPLILADGIEVSLRQVNPNDIESVSILKDASASAIYGAKASAGVVLITTKNGSSKDGYAKIRYSGRFGVTQNTTSTDFITTGYDKALLTNNFYKATRGLDLYLYDENNGGLQKLQDRRGDKTEHPDRPWVEIADDGKYYYYGNFDWYNYLYEKNRTQQEHNVSISGGNDKINYYASGRYLQQYGVFKVYKDNFEDLAFRAKVDAKIKPWLRYSNNISFDKSDYEYAGRFDYDHTISALQSNMPAMYVPRNPDGSIVLYTHQAQTNSPIGQGHAGSITADKTRNNKEIKHLVISNQFDFYIVDGLVVTASYGYRQRQNFNKYRNNTFEFSRQVGVFETFSSGSVEDSYEERRGVLNEGSWNIYATYDKSWKNAHNFKIVGGGQYVSRRVDNLDIWQSDLLSDQLASFPVATGNITLGQSISAYKTLGYFSRANYDYKGKYLVEASIRTDGSSNFIKESRWGTFLSASAGWRISEEAFFAPAKRVISDLKIRASAGSLGNQQTSAYQYMQTISTDNEMSYTFDDAARAYSAKVSAPNASNLTWETVTTYNIGVDMTMFRHKLVFSADYFVRDTKDMLAPSLTLPNVYGAGSPKENSANLRTNGWEITLGWSDHFTLLGKRFKYNVSASLGDHKTKITRFHNPSKEISSYYEGMTLGEIWGYRVAGLFGTDREAAEYQAAINDKAVNQRVYNSKLLGENILRAGDVRFIDLDGNNIISAGAGTVDNPGDKRIIGNNQPRYSYSFRLGFNWYGFDVSTFFQGIGRKNWFPASDQASYDFWGPYALPSTSFIHKDFESMAWSESNRGAYFPRQRGYQAYSGGSLGETNDRYMQNVAYLRFKNITVGYTIPVAKKHIDRLRVYFSGENLYYWSPLKKYNKTIDPELTVTSGTYDTNSGTGYAYPRTFSFGVEIVF